MMESFDLGRYMVVGITAAVVDRLSKPTYSLGKRITISEIKLRQLKSEPSFAQYPLTVNQIEEDTNGRWRQLHILHTDACLHFI